MFLPSVVIDYTKHLFINIVYDYKQTVTRLSVVVYLGHDLFNYWY